MNGKWIIALMAVCIFLSSCVEANQLEKLGIIQARGVDFSEGQDQETGLIESTMSIFQFQAQTQEYTKIITGVGNTIKGTIKDASNESNFKLVPGKLQLDVYGKEVAESGLNPFLDTLRRDANVPDTMFLAVSETTAKEIMMTNTEKITTNIGQYLHGLIEEIAQGDHFPKATLQEFMTTVNIQGKDPILPVLSFEDTDVPRISQVGIFSNDKYVGNVDISEMELFNLLDKSVEARRIEVTLPSESIQDIIAKKLSGEESEMKETFHTSYIIEHGKGKIIQKKDDPLSFVTEVNMDLNLLETSMPLNFDKPDAIKILEDAINKELETRYKDILKQLKEMGADPFGYGIIYRINQEDGKLDMKEWKEIYPDIKVEFKIDVDLIRHGITGK